MTFHLAGVPIPAEAVDAADDGTTVLDGDGQPVTRWRTEKVAPLPRCKCSHARSQHTRGAGNCWSPVCGCGSYREKGQ